MRRFLGLCAATLLTVAPALGWEHWGGDPGGMRFSPLAQITPANVDSLLRAWEFRTGDLDTRPPAAMGRTKFQATPLLVEDSLIFCSPFNEVIALDPGTGAQKWRFDPGISTSQRPGNRYTCRGVAEWVDAGVAETAACRARIFMGTNDVRVIALDARTGIPCADFGANGQIKLETGQLEWPGEFQITSAPVVSRGVVIVGSSISDNRRVEAPLGTVRAFDARTGVARWSWDPLVHGGIVAGHANVWAPMSTDEDRGLVFLPTSSPSPDFWGGKRPGNNEHADSVVALRSETGELVWSFQNVHHDVWDYDLPAQPTLARIDTGDGLRDVVIQPTKQGFVFVLDRDTGKPVWPVEERRVPQGGAEGEQLSPTQPFPTHVPALMPQQFSSADVFKPFPAFGRTACEQQLESLRNDGLYTPPSTQGTLIFPMTGGGVNWGGAAFDPVHQILYANTSYAVHIVKLIPRTEAEGFKSPAGHDFGPQQGAPFAITREVAISPLGILCNKPPWGAMVAVDLKAGKILWKSSVGTSEDRAPLGIAFGHAAGQRRRDYRGRSGLYRRDGCLSARLRRQIRRGTVAGQAAGPRRRQSHDLSLEGRTICRDRCRRSFRSRHDDRRQRGGLSSAPAGRSALAVVAHRRPARRTIPEQGDHAGARDCADGGRGVALAPPRKTAPNRHEYPTIGRGANSTRMTHNGRHAI